MAFPDTLVGTDSHTTMINGLGVLGYGVGGIEAEAVLLGQPLYQPLPRVVGVRLHGELPRGSTATDLVLVISQMLRKHGVVGTFVEFAGDGLASLALADRATIANMSPEYGATTALFPVDDETLAYLRLTGRDEGRSRSSRPTPRSRACGAGPAPAPTSTRRSSSTWPPSSPPWPARAGRRTGCPWATCATASGRTTRPPGGDGGYPAVAVQAGRDGDRTSEPRWPRARWPSRPSPAAPTPPTRRVMVGAGLLARNAVGAGLRSAPTVKTSLAPGLAGGDRVPASAPG